MSDNLPTEGNTKLSGQVIIPNSEISENTAKKEQGEEKKKNLQTRS